MENMYYQELYHHGVKGQRWGIRRYKNDNGSINEYGAKKFNRTVGRIQRLENRAAKLGIRSKKANKKAADLEYKALRSRTTKGYQKRLLKSKKMARKSARLEYSSVKSIKRGTKIYNSIPDEFKNKTVSSVDPDKLDYARRYAAKYLR